jgi:hypothetical protein
MNVVLVDHGVTGDRELWHSLKSKACRPDSVIEKDPTTKTKNLPKLDESNLSFHPDIRLEKNYRKARKSLNSVSIQRK